MGGGGKKRGNLKKRQGTNSGETPLDHLKERK